MALPEALGAYKYRRLSRFGRNLETFYISLSRRFLSKVPKLLLYSTFLTIIMGES